MYSVNNSPSLDNSLSGYDGERIRVNARHVCIKFVRIGIVPGYV